MFNQVVIVGRLANEVSIEGEGVLTLLVPRIQRTKEDFYETDIIEVYCYEDVVKHYYKDDIVGVKGRLERLEGNTLTVRAERIVPLGTNNDYIKEEL